MEILYDDKQLLRKAEAEIKEGHARMATGCITVIVALQTIKEKELYKAAKYSSFDEYVVDRHSLDSRYCHEMIRIYETFGDSLSALSLSRLKQLISLPESVRNELIETKALPLPEGKSITVEELANSSGADFKESVQQAKQSPDGAQAEQDGSKPSKRTAKKPDTIYHNALARRKTEEQLSKAAMKGLAKQEGFQRGLEEHLVQLRASLTSISAMMKEEEFKIHKGDILELLSDDEVTRAFSALFSFLPIEQALSIGNDLIATSLECIKEDIEVDPSEKQNLATYRATFRKVSILTEEFFELDAPKKKVKPSKEGGTVSDNTGVALDLGLDGPKKKAQSSKEGAASSDNTGEVLELGLDISPNKKKRKKKVEEETDPRVKTLVDFYYKVWENKPPETLTGKPNGGGRIARTFQELLRVSQDENPVEHIKKLYLFYKNGKPENFLKADKWLFEGRVRSIVQFSSVVAYIVECYQNSGGENDEVVVNLFGPSSSKDNHGVPDYLLKREASC